MGMVPAQAIREACILRFRPIMMTTLAALMGALLLAFGLGAGAELWQPLGLVVVGGLLFFAGDHAVHRTAPRPQERVAAGPRAK